MNAHLFEPQYGPRCPKCAAPTRLTHGLLDSRSGNTVRLFHCTACGDRLWDDGSQAAISRMLTKAGTGDPPRATGGASDPEKNFEVPHLRELAAKTARKAHE